MNDSETSPLVSGVDEAPPAVDDLENDPKFNRKREREGSIEPSIPSASASGEIRDQRSPAKKNRVILSATSEEDSPPHSSITPPEAGSPTGSRVSQIRERVKGLNWKDGEDVPGDIHPDKDAEATASLSAGTEPVSSNALQMDPSTKEDIKEPRELSRSPSTTDLSVSDSGISRPAGDSAVKPEVSAEVVSESPDTKDIPPSPPESEGPEAQGDIVPPLRRSSLDGEPRTDKNLKRKSRESSYFGVTDGSVPEVHKRPRDDPPSKETGEAKPEESSILASSEPTATSAPSPTPAQDATPIKIGGFAAYSSRPSPFITTAASSTSFLDKGPKLPPPAKPTGFTAFTSSPFADFVASSGSKSPLRVSSPTPQSTSGFSMFTNKPSPFLSSSPKPPSTPTARGSTPKSGEAFGSYSNTPTHFGASLSPGDGKVTASVKKKFLGASDSTFGDILASDKGGESECKENKFGNIEEVDIHTGEEHEKTVHQTRAKLYTMDSRDTYKERGTGLLKVNVRKSDGRGGRLVMRADGVFRLILNASLFTGMPCSLGQDPKFVKLSVIEDGAFIHHAIKVGNVKVAQDLVDTIQAHIPQPSSSTSPKPSAD